MKKFLFFSLFILSFHTFSQQIITGKVTDADTHEALSFANIWVNKNQGSVSDFDGSFELKIDQTTRQFHVSYIGYQSKSIDVVPGKKHYEISLQPIAESLQAVVIDGKYENPAIPLMKKAVKLKKGNNYQKKLRKYAYTKYVKFIMGADTDKIEKEFDTVYKNGKLYKIDSTLYKFKKELANKYMWIFESLMKINAQNENEKSEVIATRTAGLKKPLYEFLAMQVSGQNLYDDYYKFLFQSYVGPFSKLSFKQYRYEIEDSLLLQNRPVIVVNYKNTEKPLISGKIYLDRESLAIAKLTLNTYKEFQFKAVYDFKYQKEADIWFPAGNRIDVKKAKNKKDVNFGNAIVLRQNPGDTIVNKDGDTLVNTRNKSELDYTYVHYTVDISDVQINRVYPIKIKYNMQVAPLAYKRNEDFWAQYTRTHTTEKEKNTYKYVDSIAEKENFEQGIDKIKKMLKGYVPVHKYFDFDLLRLIDFNRYEKLRLQLGGKTSENLSDKWQFSTYLAYGFGDKEFKYSGSARYKLKHTTQTYLRVSYTKNLVKSGNFKTIDERNIFSVNHHFADDKFFMQKAFSFDLSHLLSPNFKFYFNFTQGDASTKFDVPYNNGRIEFPDKDIAYFQTGFEITPFAKYMLAPEGRKLIKDGYPKIYFSFERSLSDLTIDQSSYYRMDLQTLVKKTYRNKTYSELMLRFGMAAKGSGINKLYQPVTNDFEEDHLLKSINLSNKFSFETINDYEFVDNFLVTSHLRHTFPKIRTWKNNHIDISLIGRMAFGLSYDENNYTGIQSLDKIYYESGIEFHKLIGSLGLGFYYRMGTYAHPDKWENLSIRITTEPIKLFL